MTFSGSFILWSGGKESYLTLRRALEEGVSVGYALSYVDRRTKRLVGCYLREEVVREQTRLLGLRFFPVYGSKRKGDFGSSLRKALEYLGVGLGFVGEIGHPEHRNFLERVCQGTGVSLRFPLWGVSEEEIIKDTLRSCRALIVCRRVKVIPKRFLGEVVDRGFVSFLRKRELSLCGEQGEYQTFVIEGEGFSLSYSVSKKFRRSYYECIDLCTGGKP